MECGPEFNNSRNAVLHLFDSLEIVRYEVVRDKGDFADRRETDVMRLVARKTVAVPSGPCDEPSNFSDCRQLRRKSRHRWLYGSDLDVVTKLSESSCQTPRAIGLICDVLCDITAGIALSLLLRSVNKSIQSAPLRLQP
jgi:hypothetical protein